MNTPTPQQKPSWTRPEATEVTVSMECTSYAEAVKLAEA